MPKRPQNAYLLFCNLEREKVKLQHPEMTKTEVNKLLGERWKAMPKENKTGFYTEYNKEKEQYDAAMKVYEQTKLGLPVAMKRGENESIIEVEDSVDEEEDED